MSTETATIQAPAPTASIWDGGRQAFGASWGKLMMWFYLLSDAFTFAGLLISYGMIRFSHGSWAIADQVFNSVPFIEANAPLVFVGIMTFILIMSSVTMVLAVEAGHENDKWGVVKYMIFTIIGGLMFLSCQAFEWTHLIEHGTAIGQSHHTAAQATAYGPQAFADLFFVITGFHGFHVFSGVVILTITMILAATGYMERKKDYELVEKVGLFWHFVDLVWVFVFTFFYLV